MAVNKFKFVNHFVFMRLETDKWRLHSQVTPHLALACLVAITHLELWFTVT